MSQQTWGFSDTVESVVYARDNGTLIATVAALHTKPDDVVLDMTYGRGMFWTKYRPDTLIEHDIAIDGIDFRDLPEDNNSINIAVFDPPYIAGGGTETQTIPDFLDRYGLDNRPANPLDLRNLFADGIAEATRVITRGGQLWVKCMDFVVAGRYQQIRHHVVETAMDHGLAQIDEFVHHSGVGPGNNQRTQRTSRRAHSFLCVFRKPLSWEYTNE